jgi:dUTP pyrophosphatase
MERIKVECLLEDGFLPEYQTSEAAGADVKANIIEDVILEPGERYLVPTGLRLHIPAGYEAEVRPRSGLAFKHGITLLNAPGTIDADYRGELKILVINLGNEPFCISRGQRIAQLVFKPVVQADFAVVKTLADSERGAGGFGSTGA